MNILFALLLSTLAFSQDFVFDKEKGRAIPSYVGQIKLLKGKVFKRNAEGTSEVEHGSRFKKNDVLITGEKSFARVQIVDDTLISVGPSSEIKFDEFDFVDKTNRKLSFSLLKGQITGDVKNKAKPGDIKFRTKYTSMGVRGTYFLMNHQMKPAMAIAEYALLSGKVDVTGDKGQMVALKKGDRVVLIHDFSRNLSANDRMILPAEEFQRLSGKKINEENDFKPFLPYFSATEVDSLSPLYPLVHTVSNKVVTPEAAIEKREDPKPHYEETLKELNKKLRENQKNR